jgi:23S rRNA pseudouridine1911/1915/1917 synthase
VSAPRAGRFEFSDRTLVASPELTPAPLDRLLRSLYPGASWNDVRRLITTGKVSIGGARIDDPAHGVQAGATVTIRMTARRAGDAARLPESALLFVDPQVVVVAKPAGISTVPFDETEAGTLDQLVRDALRRHPAGRRKGPEPELGIVHRLDKETSGVLVFARTLAAKRALKQEFRFHRVERRYLAIAHGRVAEATLRSRLVKDRGDGRRGSTDNPELGREAVTHVRALETLAGATLIECRLETGRTHQIRIHLAERGHPLLGERVYIKDYGGPLLAAPRLMLHAFELGFVHPATGERLHFELELPTDMERMLAELRR